VVEVYISSNTQIGHILLKPIQSASWQTVLLIVSLISFVIFIIALYIASVGA